MGIIIRYASYLLFVILRVLARVTHAVDLYKTL